MTPLIGLILDHEPPGGYSKFPWYALRENYFSSFQEIGALCVGIPYDHGRIDAYLSLINGLVVTGGHFDVSPHLYGDRDHHDTVRTKSQRTDFEFALTQKALEKELPVLGICGGHQLLNVMFGGTLIQHIPDEVETSLNHEQPIPRDQPYHKISIQPRTHLHSIVETTEMTVNSAHHQAIKKLGDDLIINAIASDGIIEGVESSRHRFCLGLQWHPEFFTDPKDKVIFKSFVEACR